MTIRSESLANSSISRANSEQTTGSISSSMPEMGTPGSFGSKTLRERRVRLLLTAAGSASPRDTPSENI